ncbi:hypothetical protein WM21_03240 [Burkholderia ubonensis]|nr:hypothetical protein WM21_03240 [Burkholderia ubonensis]
MAAAADAALVLVTVKSAATPEVAAQLAGVLRLCALVHAAQAAAQRPAWRGDALSAALAE